jgi:dynein heavy chain
MKCFTVWQIKEESFLEDINNLLNSGEIPNIFSADEKGDICENMRELDKQQDKSVQVRLFLNFTCTNMKINKHLTDMKNAMLACVLMHAHRIISLS